METAKDILETILIAAVLTVLVRAFLFEPFLVEGPSMESTLWDGERLFIFKLVTRFGGIRRGDVVVFRYPLNLSKDYVKRCVAVEGDTIEVRCGRLYVNEQLAPEPYMHNPGVYDMKAVQVPPGHIFVMGDNRTNSEDSRSFGPVKVQNVKGKAVLILWPLKSLRLIK